jgi:hypothetical protein
MEMKENNFSAFAPYRISRRLWVQAPRACGRQPGGQRRQPRRDRQAVGGA